MLAGAHKKFYRIQHPEIYLLDLKVQHKHKFKLPLDMVSKHVFLYLCLPDYCSYLIAYTSFFCLSFFPFYFKCLPAAMLLMLQNDLYHCSYSFNSNSSILEFLKSIKL